MGTKDTNYDRIAGLCRSLQATYSDLTAVEVGLAKTKRMDLLVKVQEADRLIVAAREILAGVARTVDAPDYDVPPLIEATLEDCDGNRAAALTVVGEAFGKMKDAEEMRGFDPDPYDERLKSLVLSHILDDDYEEAAAEFGRIVADVNKAWTDHVIANR